MVRTTSDMNNAVGTASLSGVTAVDTGLCKVRMLHRRGILI